MKDEKRSKLNFKKLMVRFLYGTAISALESQKELARDPFDTEELKYAIIVRAWFPPDSFYKQTVLGEINSNRGFFD